MIRLLLVAFGLMSATVILHGLGTLAAIAHLARIWRRQGQARRRLMAEVQLARGRRLAAALRWNGRPHESVGFRACLDAGVALVHKETATKSLTCTGSASFLDCLRARL